MEMTYDRPVSLSNSEALQLMGEFFPKEWKLLKPEDVSISRCQSGINNEVYFVSRITYNGTQEPDKVVIRKYSSIAGDDEEEAKRGLFGMLATQIEQTVAMIELAERSLGPELYGVFAGGRIEQWIDCRRLTFEDSHNPEIEADIAVCMARVHAAVLPFKQAEYKFIDVLRQMNAELGNSYRFFEALGDKQLISIVKHDYASELDFLAPLLESSHNRIVFMNWDTHFGNIAVMNNPQPGQLKAMIFDYEHAAYNMRGKDLGLFLVSRSGYHPIVREDRRLESNEEFYSFLKAYRDETEKELGDRDTGDSLDHLMIESLLGGMVSLLVYLLLQSIITARKQGDDLAARSILTFFPAWFEGFTECKKALEKRFPHANKLFAA